MCCVFRWSDTVVKKHAAHFPKKKHQKATSSSLFLSRLCWMTVAWQPQTGSDWKFGHHNRIWSWPCSPRGEFGSVKDQDTKKDRKKNSLHKFWQHFTTLLGAIEAALTPAGPPWVSIAPCALGPQHPPWCAGKARPADFLGSCHGRVRSIRSRQTSLGIQGAVPRREALHGAVQLRVFFSNPYCLYIQDWDCIDALTLDTHMQTQNYQKLRGLARFTKELKPLQMQSRTRDVSHLGQLRLWGPSWRHEELHQPCPILLPGPSLHSERPKRWHPTDASQHGIRPDGTWLPLGMPHLVKRSWDGPPWDQHPSELPWQHSPPDLQTLGIPPLGWHKPKLPWNCFGHHGSQRHRRHFSTAPPGQRNSRTKRCLEPGRSPGHLAASLGLQPPMPPRTHQRSLPKQRDRDPVRWCFGHRNRRPNRPPDGSTAYFCSVSIFFGATKKKWSPCQMQLL